MDCLFAGVRNQVCDSYVVVGFEWWRWRIYYVLGVWVFSSCSFFLFPFFSFFSSFFLTCDPRFLSSLSLRLVGEERTVGCWDATNNREAVSSKCPFPPPRPDEECRNFACGSTIGVGGLQLALPFHRINASVLHQDVFEKTLTLEIAAAAGVDSKSVHIMSSKSGLSGLATLVRVEIHPGVGAVTVDSAIKTLSDQARDPDSFMRTEGSFLRRISN